MKRTKYSTLLFAVCFSVLGAWLSVPSSHAAIPKLLTYQGVLKNSSGSLLTGTYSMTFKIYDIAIGGTALWTETQSSVSVSSGKFSAVLGSVTALNLSFGSDYWLSLQVGTNAEMTQRIRLTSLPFALRAEDLTGGKFTPSAHSQDSHMGIEGVRSFHANIAKTNFKIDAVRLASANNMGDLLVDVFTDATGIDAASSTNHKHRASPDYDVVRRSGSGIDSNAKLVIHANGTDASTSFSDASSAPHTVTANGNAQVDTAQSEFGGASALFDGTNSYLSIPSDADFDFGTGDFTIDFWVRFNSTTGLQSLITRNSNNDFAINKQANGTVAIWIEGTQPIETAWNPTAGTWYHAALVRSGTSVKFFSNGIQLGATGTSSHNITGTTAVNIGRDTTGVQYFNGWIDELRISKGIARWTTNFTPPGAEYEVPPTGDANVISAAYTQSTAPKEVLVTAQETLGTGSIIYYVSRNNGTNWTSCTKEVLCNIDSQPSGTQVRWKAVIAGNAELDGISVGL